MSDSGPLDFSLPNIPVSVSPFSHTTVQREVAVAERNTINLAMFEGFRSRQYISSNSVGKMGKQLTTFAGSGSQPAKHTNISLPMMLHFQKNVFGESNQLEILTELKNIIYSTEFSLLVFTPQSIQPEYRDVYNNDTLKGLFRQILNLAADKETNFQTVFDKYTICQFLLILLGKALISQQQTKYGDELNSEVTLKFLSETLGYKLTTNKNEWDFSNLFTVYIENNVCWFEKPFFYNKAQYVDAIEVESKNQSRITEKLGHIAQKLRELRQQKMQRIYKTLHQVTQSQSRKLQLKFEKQQLEFDTQISELKVYQLKAEMEGRPFDLRETNYYKSHNKEQAI